MRSRLFKLSVLSALASGFVATDLPAQAVSKTDVVNWLKHQEDVVHSAHAIYETWKTATVPSELQVLREVIIHLDSGYEYETYVYDEELARKSRSLVSWFRSDIKERYEYSFLEDGESAEPTSIEVFDGRVVRSFEPLNSNGSIYPASEWNSINRASPFSFLYYFQDARYSEIIQRANGVNISYNSLDGERHLVVAFRHPDFGNRDFVLWFDKDHRLAKRESIVQLDGKSGPFYLKEVHQFLEYKQIDEGSGELFDFPHQAVIHYQIGKLPDGTYAEYTTEVFKLREISFNIDIPSDKFTLEFPVDSHVYDVVSGIGWGDNVPVDPSDTEPRSRVWWMFLGVNCFVIVLVLAFLVRKRGRMMR